MTTQTTLFEPPPPTLGGGSLPDGWEIRDLRDCGKWLSGGTPSRSNPDYWGGDIPWVSAKSMRSFTIDDAEEYVTEAGAQNGTRMVPENTLLFVVRGMSLAKEFRVGLTSRPVTFNQDLKALRPAADVDPLYLALALAAAEGRVLHMVDTASHGTAKLNTARLEALPLLLPPFPIQQRLAEAVDTWDRAVRKLEVLTAAIEDRQRGLIQQLFPDHEADAPSARLSGFGDSSWVQVTIGEIFRERREKNHDHLPLLAVTGEWGVIPRDNLDRKDTSASDKSRYLRALPGDIVYNTMRMWQGVAGLSAHEGIVSPAYTVAVPKKSMDARFAAHLFKHPLMIHRFYRYSQGLVSDTWNLKFRHFKEVKALIPPTVDEQRAIADVLDAGEREISLLRQERAALLNQKKGLMQRLLTGHVRVPETASAEASS